MHLLDGTFSLAPPHEVAWLCFAELLCAGPCPARAGRAAWQGRVGGHMHEVADQVSEQQLMQHDLQETHAQVSWLHHLMAHWVCCSCCTSVWHPRLGREHKKGGGQPQEKMLGLPVSTF